MKNYPRTPTELFQFFTRRSALSLETKGLRHSRGSVYALCKREYDLRGNRQNVLNQMNLVREEILGEMKK